MEGGACLFLFLLLCVCFSFFCLRVLIFFLSYSRWSVLVSMRNTMSARCTWLWLCSLGYNSVCVLNGKLSRSVVSLIIFLSSLNLVH